MSEQQESLIEFPCEFAIKAMGPAGVDLDVTVVSIIRKHVADLREGAVSVRESSGGKFISVTVSIDAQSKQQLDTIYQELSAHEHVKYVL